MGKTAADDNKHKAKIARLSATTSKFTTAHKHPRRTSRPIIAKGNKSARLEREAVVAAVSEAQKQIDVLVQRIKLLEKLVKRQGSSASATGTRAQIDELRTEIGQLQEEIRSAAEGATVADEMADGGADGGEDGGMADP